MVTVARKPQQHNQSFIFHLRLYRTCYSICTVHSVPGIIKEYFFSTEPGWEDAENSHTENSRETENDTGAETSGEHTEGERWSFIFFILFQFESLGSVMFFKDINIFIRWVAVKTIVMLQNILFCYSFKLSIQINKNPEKMYRCLHENIKQHNCFLWLISKHWL